MILLGGMLQLHLVSQSLSLLLASSESFSSQRTHLIHVETLLVLAFLSSLQLLLLPDGMQSISYSSTINQTLNKVMMELDGTLPQLNKKLSSLSILLPLSAQLSLISSALLVTIRMLLRNVTRD